VLELLELKLPSTGKHDHQFKIITGLPSWHFIPEGEYLHMLTAVDRHVSPGSPLGKQNPRRFSRKRTSNNTPQPWSALTCIATKHPKARKKRKKLHINSNYTKHGLLYENTGDELHLQLSCLRFVCLISQHGSLGFSCLPLREAWL